MKKLFLIIILCTNNTSWCMMTPWQAEKGNMHPDTDKNTALLSALCKRDSEQNHTVLKNLLSDGSDIIAAVASGFETNGIGFCAHLSQHIPFLETQNFHVFSFRNAYNEYNPIFFLQDKSTLKKLLVQSNQKKSKQSYEIKNDRVKVHAALDSVHEVFKALMNKPSDQDFQIQRVFVFKHLLFLYKAHTQDLENYFGKKNSDYAQSLVAWHLLFAAIANKDGQEVVRLLRDNINNTTNWNNKWKKLYKKQFCGELFLPFLLERHDVVTVLTKDLELLDTLIHLPYFPVELIRKPKLLEKRYETKDSERIMQKALFALLMHALKQQDWNKAYHIIKSGVNLKQKDELSHNSALHQTIYYEQCNPWKSWLFKSLIMYGASVHEANDHNITPLALAARQNKAPFVHLLLKAGATVHCFNVLSPYNSLLFTPIKYHNSALVKELLDNGVFINKEYSMLTENGFFGQPYTCPKISSMLKKAYQDPHYPYPKPACHKCLKYTVKNIKCCNATHEHTFLCRACYNYCMTTTNQCPVCHEKLVSWRSKDESAEESDDEYDNIDLF